MSQGDSHWFLQRNEKKGRKDRHTKPGDASTSANPTALTSPWKQPRRKHCVWASYYVTGAIEVNKLLLLLIIRHKRKHKDQNLSFSCACVCACVSSENQTLRISGFVLSLFLLMLMLLLFFTCACAYACACACVSSENQASGWILTCFAAVSSKINSTFTNKAPRKVQTIRVSAARRVQTLINILQTKRTT